MNGSQIECCQPSFVVPSIGSVVYLASSQDQAAYAIASNVKQETVEIDDNKEEVNLGHGGGGGICKIEQGNMVDFVTLFFL